MKGPSVEMAVAALARDLERLETGRMSRLTTAELASDMRTYWHHPRMGMCAAVAKAFPWGWHSAKLMLGSTGLNSPYERRDAS